MSYEDISSLIRQMPRDVEEMRNWACDEPAILRASAK